MVLLFDYFPGTLEKWAIKQAKWNNKNNNDDDNIAAMQSKLETHLACYTFDCHLM